MDFRPRESSTNYAYVNGHAVSRTSVAGYLSAPLDLPQGAKVTRLTVFFDNTVAGNAGALSITRYDLTGAIADPVFVATTSVAGWHANSADLSPAVAIDNSAYAYVLIWIPPANANALAGARVEYTLP